MSMGADGMSLIPDRYRCSGCDGYIGLPRHIPALACSCPPLLEQADAHMLAWLNHRDVQRDKARRAAEIERRGYA